uniref:Solute carrier family 25 member 43 n=1 Tax=Pelusios castaneus TaxID=367368 RepID=A0A8C8VE41_9SAUR
MEANLIKPQGSGKPENQPRSGDKAGRRSNCIFTSPKGGSRVGLAQQNKPGVWWHFQRLTHLLIASFVGGGIPTSSAALKNQRRNRDGHGRLSPCRAGASLRPRPPVGPPPGPAEQSVGRAFPAAARSEGGGPAAAGRAMATWKRDGRVTGCQRLGCAGLAGALSLSLTAPLELLTVLAQVGTCHSRRGLWQAGRSLARAEGIGALWKGNLTACLRLVPHSALQLAAYRRFVMLCMDDLGHMSQGSAIMAGSLAGIFATIATYPTDVVKTRLIVQNRLEPSYKGILHAFYTIYHQEGFLALYRGVSLTVLGAIPFSAGSFFVYISLNKMWQEPSFRFSPLQNFINGCLAASVAQTLSFPFETIKRKMQAQSPCLPHYGGADVHFTGMVDCFRQTVKTKGIFGLWSGLTASLLKIVPYYGVMFSTFEFCKRVCLYRNGYIVSPLSYKLTPGVDQSLQPQELRELKLRQRGNFEPPKPTLEN